MKSNYSYLHDVSFLKQVAKAHIQTYYVKITILNWKEDFVQDIEGRVISGSINIDGNSAIRRTLNLSIYIDNLINKITNAQNLLSINKKIRVEIGYKNIFNQYTQYETLWFPQGIYIVSSCNISYSDSGLTVNLSAKDKMCLLNGQCGGTFPAAVILDTYETLDENGDYIIQRPSIYQIIQELVHHFGEEPLDKIIISDVDALVKQVVKWNQTSNLYWLQSQSGQNYYTTDFADYQNQLSQGFFTKKIFEYGQDVGFIYTDFTYPQSSNVSSQSNFICEAGSTIVDALQKIINEVLGNYEFFYDIDGNFVFREIKNYLNNAQSKYISEAIKDNEILPDYLDKIQLSPYLAQINQDKSAVSLINDNDLIISYNNSPQYGLIKNDIVVWGIRKGLNDFEYPIRYHLVIDKKPKPGNIYYAFKIDNDGVEEWHTALPWKPAESSLPTPGTIGLYYIDITNENDSLENCPITTWQENDNYYSYTEVKNLHIQKITTTDWRTELFFQGTQAAPYGIDSNYYYAELKYEWPKIYDIEKGQFKEATIKNPTGIDYYLDFIQPSSELFQLSVENIGRRTKAFNENKSVNCVFENDIPDIVFINQELVKEQNLSSIDMNDNSNPWPNQISLSNNPKRLLQECYNRGQKYYIVAENIYNSFTIGGNYNSAYQIIRQLIQQYVSYNETISIQTLPLYFLEPNTRLSLRNDISNIFGDYIINTLSFSFDVSSTLTINASRVLEKI